LIYILNQQKFINYFKKNEVFLEKISNLSEKIIREANKQDLLDKTGIASLLAISDILRRNQIV
jgi:hypothetical protein